MHFFRDRGQLHRPVVDKNVMTFLRTVLPLDLKQRPSRARRDPLPRTGRPGSEPVTAFISLRRAR
jgi:hypothetical protein